MGFTESLKIFLSQLNARKPEIFVWIWPTVIGCMLAACGTPPIWKTLFVVFSITALAISGYTYNDIADLQADSLNPTKKKIRPVTAGKLSIKDATKIVWAFGLLGIFLSVFTTPSAFILTLIWSFLLYGYSHPKIKLKRRLFFKELIISFGFPLVILIGALSAGTLSSAVLFGSVLMFAFSFSFLPAIRETPDIEEDKVQGVKSLSMLISLKTRVEMAILFVLIIMTLTPLTYVHLNLNVVFPIITVASCFVLLRFLFPLLRHFDHESHKHAYRASYVFWLVLQVSLVIGVLPLSVYIGI